MPDDPSHIHARGGGGRFAVELTSSVLLGALTGLISAFQALHTLRGLWIGVAATTLAAVALGIAVAEAWASASAPLAVGVGWLLCVGYFAAGRPEGDVVVPGSLQGYAFLFLGLAAFAPGVRLGVRRQRRSATPEADSGR